MDKTLPQLRSIPEFHDFKQLTRMSKWSNTNTPKPFSTQPSYTASTWNPNQHHHHKSNKPSYHKIPCIRRNILQMLDQNRRDLFQKTFLERQTINLSYMKMLKVSNQLSKKNGQIKIKRNRRNKSLDTSTERMLQSYAEIKEVEKIVTDFAVALQKIEYWSYQQFFGFREGATLASCDRVLYLHGGYSGEFDNKKSHLHQFDFTTKIWSESQQKGEVPAMSRIGQTVQQWRGSLYYIGGMGLNLFGRKRLYSTDLSIYNPDKGQWSKAKSLQPKRYHASTRYLHYIIVYGGINQKQQYLGNITVINLQNMNSASLSFHFPEDVNGLAYHRMVSTMELDSKKRVDLVRDGVYCFGGKDNNGEYAEGVKVMMTEVNSNGDLIPREWVKLKTQGICPEPRVNHSMNLLPRPSSICIIGGQSPQNKVFRDIHILNLLNLNWYTPHIMFDEVLANGLSGHATTVLGSKIYIFGGLQYNGKYSPNLVEVETDQNRIHTNMYLLTKKLAPSANISVRSSVVQVSQQVQQQQLLQQQQQQQQN